MSGATLPKLDEFARTLTSLFGGVAVTAAPGPAMPAATKMCVATYDDGAGNLECLLLCDFMLAASFGCVLTRMPRGAAEDAVKDGELPPDMFDNTREVVNICANSFQTKRVRLTDFYIPGSAYPDAVKALLAKPLKRLDGTISIANYHGGKIAMLVS